MCVSRLASSQFTQVTLVPRFTVTCCGMKVKSRMKMTTVPAAAVDMGIRHSPVSGSGPVAGCLSEKQLANAKLPKATMAAVAATAFRELNGAALTLFFGPALTFGP